MFEGPETTDACEVEEQNTLLYLRPKTIHSLTGVQFRHLFPQQILFSTLQTMN